MKNILTIYKFNFPFLFNKFEKTKYKAILSDLKELLLYNEIYISTKLQNNNKYEISTLNFIGGYIQIEYYKNNNFYFIPQFQLDIFIENKINNIILENIIKIFETIGFDEYIFDNSKFDNIYNKFDNIISLKKLEKNFEKYNYNSLEKFLQNTDTKYIDNKLKQNSLIRNSFYYMIYICYLCFKNSHDSKENIKNIEKLLGTKIHNLYKLNLELGRTKLTYLNELNLSYFKKYKLMLDKLFDILKNI